MSCHCETDFSVCVTGLACFDFRPEAVAPDLMALALKAANAQDEGPLAALEPNMGCSKDDLVGVSV